LPQRPAAAGATDLPQLIYNRADQRPRGSSVPQLTIAVSACSLRQLLPAVRRLAVFLISLALIASTVGAGRATAEPAGADPAVHVPGFWDPRRRPEKPDLSRISVIRFLTETDYPPFNFAGPDGNPQGFNVDLARLLCEVL
jgi:polar amino acid transport system substrate-binding protein